MSVNALDKLEAEVGKRNGARYEAAIESLLARGMECNEMPSPAPDPLDQPHLPVVLGPAPTARVSMDVEREELDVECTDVVQ